MKKTLGLIIGLLLSISLVWAASNAGPPTGDSRIFGKTLVGEYKLDEQVVEKMRSHKPNAPSKHDSGFVNMAMATSVDWKGPQVPLEPAKNPYAMVVTLVATALADGDAITTFKSGWEIEDGNISLTPLGGLNKLKAKAGERFVVTVRANPRSVTEPKSIKPYLGLNEARNMRIEALYVQVWSGIPGNSWRDYFGASTALLTGLIMLLLWWWLRRS